MSDAASNRRINTVVTLAACTAVAVALIALVYKIDPAFRPGHGAAGDIGLSALNALPGLLLVSLLLALTRRPLLATWCTALLYALLYAIDWLKLHTLERPLLPGDFELVSQLGSGWRLLERYVPKSGCDLLLFALLAAVTIAVLLVPLRVAMRARTRVALGAISISVGASLILGFTPWQAVYSDERLGFRLWSPADSADHAGLVASLLRYHWEASRPLPEPNRAAAAILAARHQMLFPGTDRASVAIGELPDIIVLQSESFFDASRLKELEQNQVAPRLRQLDARATHGDLWVPTYGGGTIRTEFEVLTGIALRYFPQSSYPYYDLAAHPLPSLASVLRAHGYRTLAVHPHDPAFWNRATAFKAMGFDRFDSDAAFGDSAHEGNFVGDEALVDHVLARLEAGTSPAFIFAVSIENHGPYDESPGVDAQFLDAQLSPPGLPADASVRLRDYLYHLGNADRSLGRLVDALQKRGRRSLVLFYGDHLPALPKVYRHLGFDDGLAETLQPVPYLLLDTASSQEHVTDTSSFFLAAQLLEAAGIRDPYFEVLGAVREETHFVPEYTPAEDAYLGALMQMRQRSEWPTQKDLPSIADTTGE